MISVLSICQSQFDTKVQLCVSLSSVMLVSVLSNVSLSHEHGLSFVPVSTPHLSLNIVVHSAHSQLLTAEPKV